MLSNARALNLLAFAACAALLGYALYAQDVLGPQPCTMCIFQLIGIIILGTIFLSAAVHNPHGWGA